MLARRTLMRTVLGLGGIAMVSGSAGSARPRSMQAGSAESMEYRKGTVLEWNPVTLENVIEVGTSPMVNLPVLGVGEATTIVPGSIVGLMVVGGTYAVIGRLVIPGSAEASEAVSLLDAQIKSAQIFANENCASTTFTDLTTIGPVVQTNVGPSGRVLVIATGQLGWTSAAAGTIFMRGDLGVDLTGANIHAPDIVVDPLLPLDAETWAVSAGTIQNANARTITGQAVLEGLNPGPTQFKLMYRKSTLGAGAADCQFARRTLTVIRL